MARVVVHIDRLVLQGLDRRDAASLAASLEAELAARLSQPGALERLQAAESSAKGVGLRCTFRGDPTRRLAETIAGQLMAGQRSLAYASAAEAGPHSAGAAGAQRRDGASSAPGRQPAPSPSNSRSER